MLFAIWFGVAAVALVIYFRELYTRLGRKQLNHRPIVPLLGNAAAVAFRQEHMIRSIQRSYEEFPDDRLIGHYELIKPTILVKDIELLKRIAVKDFEYFIDRLGFGADAEPVVGRNLILLKGEDWKNMRSTLSPAFTSSKIRQMVPFMLEVAEKMIEKIQNETKKSHTGYSDFNVKDLATRFANDIIATCAFGLQVNSQVEDNEFYKKAETVANINFDRFIKFLGYRSFPGLMKKLDVRLVPIQVTDYFTNVFVGTMKQREEKNIIRPDMIHLLMESKKGKLTHDDTSTEDTSAGFATVEESSVGKKNVKNEWTDTELVAQAMLFIVAGLETVSTTFSFLLHELALNPDIQERLVKEIRENEAKNGGKFDYSSVQGLAYLDMVISETLRKWPPAPNTDRKCVKDYNVGRPNKQATKDLIIRKGEVVSIPIYSLHRDPAYYPQPEKFDPERFSEENRHKIKPFTYMPFGVGPRNCIGSRFALCELKVMAYQLLKQVEVAPCPKTCVTNQLGVDTIAMRLKGGQWLRFRMRD